ncbi:MAG: hypothetical protein ACKVPX_15645 [Myxococcaceae bacterium]
MGTFKSFIEAQKLSVDAIAQTSSRLEASSGEGRALATKRHAKRRTEAQKSYADAGLAKPPTGRGISARHVQAAIADEPLPRKVRTKLVRAVAELAKKKGGEVTHALLFGEIKVKAGKKAEAAAAAATT